MGGPLSGTSLPGCSRLDICARSPLTGIWGESSIGGQVAPQLKATGYDGIVFLGSSPGPVYLFLTDEGAELRDASHLWGMDTFETEAALKEETGDKRSQVLCIGQAGENLVKYAGVVNEQGSLAARCGMGAVMGSKNLKAVVLRGKLKYRVADEAAYKQVRRTAIDNISRSLFAEGLNLFGTTGRRGPLLGHLRHPGEELAGGAVEGGYGEPLRGEDSRHHPHRQAFLLCLPHRLQTRGGDSGRGIRHARGAGARVRGRGFPGFHAPHQRHARGGEGERPLQRIRHGRHLHRGHHRLRHRGLPATA